MTDTTSKSVSPPNSGEQSHTGTTENRTPLDPDRGPTSPGSNDTINGAGSVEPGSGLFTPAFSRGTFMDPGAQMRAHVGSMQFPFGPATPAMPSASCGTFPGFYAGGSGGPA